MNLTLSTIGGEGPPVLLIHGYGSDRQSWLATAPALFSHASVWVIDLPAHGNSSSDCNDGSLESLVINVKSALDHAGIDQLHLVGHSLGARIAMELAQRHPDRIGSLVLLSPVGVNKRVNQDFLTLFHQADDEQSVTALLQMLVHNSRLIAPQLSSGVLEYLRKPGIRTSLELITKGLVDGNDAMDATLAALAASDIPIICIWGSNDQINPPDLAAIETLGGSAHILVNCGHLPHIEKRTEVNRLIASFLANVIAS